MTGPSKIHSGIVSLFAALGVVVVVLLILAIVVGQLSPSTQRQPSVAAVKHVQHIGQNASNEATYSIGGPGRLGNNTVLRLYLGANTSGISFSSGSWLGWSRTVNYLVVDPTTNDSHWLWNAPMRLVISEYPMEPRGIKDDGSRGLMVSYVTKDTNGDDALDGSDAQTLAVIKPDGKTVVTLLEDLTRIDSVTTIDRDRLLLVYEKGGKSFSAIYLPSSYSLTLEKQLPEIAVP